MKIQGFKYTLWGINFVIVIGIGLSMTLVVLARDAVRANPSKELDEKANRIMSQKTGPASDGVTSKEIDVLWTVPIRKVIPPPEVEKPPEGAGTSGSLTATPLERLLIVSGTLGDSIVVTFIDPKIPSPKTPLPTGPRDSTPKQLYVDMGKPLPEITPEAVPVRFQWTPFPGAVVFTYDGKEVSLPIERDLEAASPIGSAGGSLPFRGPAGQVNPRRRVPPGEDEFEQGEENPFGEGSEESLAEAREVRPGNWEIPASEKEYITENAREILDQVGVEDYSEGAVRGLKITALAGDSLPAQRGFQEGDVVKSVNGQPITSQADLINFAKKMGDRLTVVRVEYYRQGKLMSTVYRVK